MDPQLSNLDETIRWLYSRSMTPASFVGDLLQSDEHTQHARELLQEHSGSLLRCLHIYAGREMSVAAQSLINETYAHEITALSNMQTGLHFRASKASAVQVAAFNLDDIEAKMCQHAPGLWDMFDVLLSADPKVHERRVKGGKASAKRVHNFLRSQKALETNGDELITAAAGIEEGADSEDEYWRDTALLMEAPASDALLSERSKTLLNIVSLLLCYEWNMTYNMNRKRFYV